MEKDIEEYRVEQFGEYDGCIYEKIFHKPDNYSTDHDGLIDRQIKVCISDKDLVLLS